MKRKILVLATLAVFSLATFAQGTFTITNDTPNFYYLNINYQSSVPYFNNQQGIGFLSPLGTYSLTPNSSYVINQTNEYVSIVQYSSIGGSPIGSTISYQASAFPPSGIVGLSTITSVPEPGNGVFFCLLTLPFFIPALKRRLTHHLQLPLVFFVSGVSFLTSKNQSKINPVKPSDADVSPDIQVTIPLLSGVT